MTIIRRATLALPSKGALAEPALAFLKDCGLRVDKPNQRQYLGYIPSVPDLLVLFQRATDVLYKVADGTAEIGITGIDVVQEHRYENVITIHDALGFGHCQLVVAVPEAWLDVHVMTDLAEVALDMREQHHRNLRIATKYPTLARAFLYEHGVHHFTLVKAEGAIEAAPMMGYADAIIDLTQTGTTLRENHLKIVSDGLIVESQACLIGNRDALLRSPTLMETVRNLLEFIDATQMGKGVVQLHANVQGVDPQTVAAKVADNPITRGLQGPTVAPIYAPNSESLSGNDWYTVTIIVRTGELLRAVEHLRSVGATQVTVIPVRYVFLNKAATFDRLQQQLLQAAKS